MKKSLIVLVFLLAPVICFAGTDIEKNLSTPLPQFEEFDNTRIYTPGWWEPLGFPDCSHIKDDNIGYAYQDGKIKCIGLDKIINRDDQKSSKKKPEKYYQEKWCSEHNGQSEVRLKDGTRVDCIATLPVDEMDGEYSIAYAIEHDFARKWAEAIGQSLHYSVMTNSFAGIVLILEKESDYKYLYRLKNVIDRCDLPIRIWFIEAWNFDEAYMHIMTHDGEGCIRWDETKLDENNLFDPYPAVNIPDSIIEPEK
jgi:hypothetical protein